jgi:hypothetical protein
MNAGPLLSEELDAVVRITAKRPEVRTVETALKRSVITTPTGARRRPTAPRSAPGAWKARLQARDRRFES